MKQSLETYELIYSSRNNRTADQADLADLLTNIGGAHTKLGEYSEALEFHRKAYEMRVRLHGNGIHRDVADSLAKLGSAHFKLAAYDKALAMYEKALEMRRLVVDGGGGSMEQLSSGDEFDVADLLANVASTCQMMGGHEMKAVCHYEQALDIYRRVLKAQNAMQPGIYENQMREMLRGIVQCYEKVGDESNIATAYRKKLLNFEKKNFSLALGVSEQQ